MFIYSEADLADLRSEMANELADPSSWRSVRERAFGDEDAWRLGAGGPWLDLMYWSITWAERQLDEVLERAVSAGSIAAAQAAAWRADLERRATEGVFFGAMTAFIVSGRKP